MGTMSDDKVTISVPATLVPFIEQMVELQRTSAYASIEFFFQNGSPQPTVKVNAVLRLKPPPLATPGDSE